MVHWRSMWTITIMMKWWRFGSHRMMVHNYDDGGEGWAELWNRHGIKIWKGCKFKWYLEWHAPYEVETFD